MRHFKIIIFLFCLSTLLSCRQSPGETWKNRIKEYQSSCLTKYPKDSADYKLVKGNLYIGKDGALYDKKIQVVKSDSSYCYSAFYYKYIDKHYDDSIVQIPLDSIIDINSYVAFDSSSYSKDKYKCYFHYDNSDGGFRSIIDKADPITFTSVKNRNYDAEDKNHKYKRGKIVG